MKIDGRKILEFAKDNNILPKFVSLLIALLLWVYISSRNTGAIEMKIPVKVLSLPKTMVVKEIENRYVSVTIKGNREDIKNIERGNLRAVINIKRFVPDQPMKYPVELQKYEIPDNVDIQLNDKSLFVVVEEKMTKSVTVEPVARLSLEDGYFMGNIIVVPDTITIEGARSNISGIDRVETDVILLENVKSTVEQDVKINTEDLANISVDPTIVKVRIPVFNALEVVKYQADLEVLGKNTQYSYSTDTSDVVVYLKKKNQSSSGGPDNLRTIIDVAEIAEKDFQAEGGAVSIVKTFPVKILFPENSGNSEIIEVIPDNVKVTVSK